MYFPKLSPLFKTLLDSVSGQPVAVIGHARPDGDCIGSQIALARVLQSLGIKTICVNGDPVPRRIQYLVTPETPFFLPDDMLSGSSTAGWTAIFVDCADHDRGGAKVRNRFPSPAGCIDHHLSNADYAAHNIVDPAAAATCEMLAGMFLDLGLPIDEITARALYAGINTDTGQFRFGSTTPRTFKLAAELVARGASPAEAGYEIYERESWGKLKLLDAFLRSLTRECDNRACIGILPDGIFDLTGTTPEDTEGLVDYARCIDGVEIGVLIEERPGAIKASLRAKNPAMRVDRIAAIFGGGGHACAAGLNMKNAPSLAEFRAQLVTAIAAQLDAVKN
ncbi:phosphoesterase RecJ-like protein [Ereboglobus sp. PH5-10]|uniref:DHH family phosphoesterase n=1 Tax=Ereboglobus sp. PH5-10 TaxID=2940629 RepID=UPI00240771C6|nr:bifunctional oligoribonuclease/PAP phosphatase NrnA [Ereboglobus sp. PH5-10]MDF9827945.1 phosphoesterase RecJ-like protein [Ereboglobus sp. PH5-10]